MRPGNFRPRKAEWLPQWVGLCPLRRCFSGNVQSSSVEWKHQNQMNSPNQSSFKKEVAFCIKCDPESDIFNIQQADMLAYYLNFVFICSTRRKSLFFSFWAMVRLLESLIQPVSSTSTLPLLACSLLVTRTAPQPGWIRTCAQSGNEQ